MQTLLQNLLNGIAAGSIYALIALGYTMVYGILKLINFAHGDIFMLGSFAGYYAGNYATKRMGGGELNSPIAAALIMLLAMIVCGVFGYLNERIAYRPLRNAPRIASLITAIGVSFLLEYGGQFVFGPDPKFFPTLIPKHIINFGGITTTNYQLIVLVVALLFMALLQYIVYGTKFGRAMRAVSYNFETASLMGIPTDRVISTTFVIGSTLAAVAGILYGLRRRGPRRHRQCSGRSRRRLDDRHHRSLRRRQQLLELPRRHRLRDPHRHPSLPPVGTVRKVPGGKGMRKAEMMLSAFCFLLSDFPPTERAQ